MKGFYELGGRHQQRDWALCVCLHLSLRKTAGAKRIQGPVWSRCCCLGPVTREIHSVVGKQVSTSMCAGQGGLQGRADMQEAAAEWAKCLSPCLRALDTVCLYFPLPFLHSDQLGRPRGRGHGSYSHCHEHCFLSGAVCPVHVRGNVPADAYSKFMLMLTTDWTWGRSCCKDYRSHSK